MANFLLLQTTLIDTNDGESEAPQPRQPYNVLHQDLRDLVIAQPAHVEPEDSEFARALALELSMLQISSGNQTPKKKKKRTN